MKNIPSEIDGAKVVYIGETEENLGYGWYIDDKIENAEPQQKRIKYLAICKYNHKNTDNCYLFACDEKFNCIHDLLYSSMDEALHNTKRYYKINNINWIKKI